MGLLTSSLFLILILTAREVLNQFGSTYCTLKTWGGNAPLTLTGERMGRMRAGSTEQAYLSPYSRSVYWLNIRSHRMLTGSTGGSITSLALEHILANACEKLMSKLDSEAWHTA